MTSLLISIIALYVQRKRLIITWGSNAYVLNPKTDIIIAGEPYPAKSNVAFYVTVDIVNPSKSDISFFDLRAFNPKTNANHYLLTKRTIVPIFKDKSILISPFPEEQFFVTIPDRTFGMIKAGSFMSLDLVVYTNPNILLDTEIMVSFKVSSTSLFHRSKYSDINRKVFREYHFSYSIKGYEKVLLNKSNIDRNDKGAY